SRYPLHVSFDSTGYSLARSSAGCRTQKAGTASVTTAEGLNIMNGRSRFTLSASGALVAICIACVSSAGADESTKQAKLTELVRGEGMVTLFEQSRASAREQGQKMVKSMAEQIFSKLQAELPDKREELDGVRSEIEAAAQQFMQEILSSFDEADAEQAWIR